MAKIGVLKRWTVQFEPNPDDPVGEHRVTLIVNDREVANASGVDDVFALQNLVEKLRAHAQPEEDVRQVLLGLEALTGIHAPRDE